MLEDDCFVGSRHFLSHCKRKSEAIAFRISANECHLESPFAVNRSQMLLVNGVSETPKSPLECTIYPVDEDRVSAHAMQLP